MGDSVETAVEPTEPTASSSEDLSCTICLATKFTNECRVDGCSHAFCFACISEWVCQSMRPSCPMCRKDVDKIFYDFEKNLRGRMEIGILEYRSGGMNLTMNERSLLLSERRLVVRNLMHAHKMMESISAALVEQAKNSEELQTTLNELLSQITQHVEKSEVILGNLRTEVVRKNKSLVFSNATFRKMLYTIQIRVKYDEYRRRTREKPDLSKDPERFRQIVNEFLMAEFDVIPLHIQPTSCGINWRTKFLGPSISVEEKTRLAREIYDLMLAMPTGTGEFQADLLSLFPQIGNSNAQLLDDHLEAIVLINKTDIQEFWQSVYYDTVFNSVAGGFMDFGSLQSMREERADRLEFIFQQIQSRDYMNSWVEFNHRLRRQTSNTTGTDRATNNDEDDDDESVGSRSPSPEERVATPMPEDPGDPDFSIYFERLRDPVQDARRREHDNRLFQLRRAQYEARAAERREERLEMFRPTVVTSRTIPFGDARRELVEANRANEERMRSLRPTARREQVIEEAARAEARQTERPVTRRGDLLSDPVRAFEESSRGLDHLMRTIREDNAEARARAHASRPFMAPPFPRPLYSELPSPPVYRPDERPRIRVVPQSRESNYSPEALAERIRIGHLRGEWNPANFSYPLPPMFLQPPSISTQTESFRAPSAFRVPAPAPQPPPAPPAPATIVPDEPSTEDREIAELLDAIDAEEEANGLDFRSVARRTRSARRAAATGASGSGWAPPAPKRPRGN